MEKSVVLIEFLRLYITMVDIYCYLERENWIKNSYDLIWIVTLTLK